MGTKLRIIVTIVVLFVMCAGFSQKKSRPQPHFDELHRLVCICGNKLVTSKPAKNWKGEFQHSHAGVQCILYEYEKCSKCGKIWIWHNMPKRPEAEVFKEKIDEARKVHKAVKDSCFSVDSLLVPSRGVCERTIKLKWCELPLYCTVEGETDPSIVEKGYPVTYSEKTGKKKKVYVTHEKPSGTPPVKGYYK